jgi:hypothetical protein
MLRERRSQRDRTVVWTAHTDAFNELARDVESPRAFLTWLAERSGEDAQVGPLVIRARSPLSRLIEGLERDPDRILNGNLIVNARTTARQAADELEKVATDAWASYLEQQPPPDAELYAGLRDHPDLERLVRDAEQQDRRYVELRNQPYLQTDRLRQEFEQLMQAREVTRQNLPDIQDDEIRAFVAAAARDGAALSALTPAVVNWLTTHGLIDTYVVRRRSSRAEGTRQR